MFSLKSVEKECDRFERFLSQSRQIFLEYRNVLLLKRYLQYCVQLANMYVKCDLQVLTLKKERRCTQVKLVLSSQKQEQLLMRWVCNLSLEQCYFNCNLRRVRSEE